MLILPAHNKSDTVISGSNSPTDAKNHAEGCNVLGKEERESEQFKADLENQVLEPEEHSQAPTDSSKQNETVEENDNVGHSHEETKVSDVDSHESRDKVVEPNKETETSDGCESESCRENATNAEIDKCNKENDNSGKSDKPIGQTQAGIEAVGKTDSDDKVKVEQKELESIKEEDDQSLVEKADTNDEKLTPKESSPSGLSSETDQPRDTSEQKSCERPEQSEISSNELKTSSIEVKEDLTELESFSSDFFLEKIGDCLLDRHFETAVRMMKAFRTRNWNDFTEFQDAELDTLLSIYARYLLKERTGVYALSGSTEYLSDLCDRLSECVANLIAGICEISDTRRDT